MENKDMWNEFFEVEIHKGRFGLHATKQKSYKNSTGVSIEIGTINEIRVLCIRFKIINNHLCAVGIREGEKITRAFEYATHKKMPVVAIVASSGMKVTEGTLALMQMAKMSSAIKLHSDKKLLYIAIVKNISLGGISASIVSLADIIIAEKNAIYGFTGRRIIERTLQTLMPDDFQTAIYASQHGMVDIVENERKIEEVILRLLKLHR